ncbi:MupA/Atu3671 family FMN-dependent luciferase-like monooxygenase [Marivita sp. S2033]|uniref:MupA/Atu3671 family FMN-dependent luciferase-like monooxygenase n=1 Tax=Marivita sp. S2033 TaxID=3373187 RepID=UPI0039822E72
MASFDCIIIGDESLTLHCADTLVSQGHALRALVTDNRDLIAWATGRNIDVLPHGPALVERFADEPVDWILSIANLNLLAREVLALARKGAVNFHDGPLPRHAGLNAPVWARIAGETTHGITWHLIDEGVDTGDILLQRFFDIAPDDTALTLNTKCFEAGLTSFSDLLSELSNDLPNRQSQAPEDRSYHALSDRPEANGMLRIDGSADDALRLIYGLNHGPYWNPLCTAKMSVGKTIVHVGKARKTASSAAPGTIIEVERTQMTIAFGDAALTVSELVAADGSAFEPVRHVAVGDILPILSEVERRDITTKMRNIAMHDQHWRRALAGINPLAVPFQSVGETDVATESTDIPAHHLGPALGIVAKRLSSQPQTVIAYANDRVAHCEVQGLVSPWVPLAIGALHEPLPNITSSFAADLPLRDPDLSPLETPALGMSDNVSVIPGTAITFEGRADGVIVHTDSGRIDADYARVLIRRVRWIAQQLADGKQHAAIDHLPPGEMRDVIEAFNATDTALNGSETMHAAFEAQVVRTPDAVALVHENDQMTYAALNERANRIAHVLRKMGVGVDTVVGLHCYRGPDLIAAALGILKAGGAYLPLDPEYPKERLAHYLSDSGAEIVVSQKALHPDLPVTHAKTLILDNDHRLSKASPDNPEPAAKPENLAYVIYTSGSTGTPKGVMVEHRNVLNFYAGMDAAVPHDPSASWLAVTSLSFDISVLELFYTMARGFKVVLPSASQRGVISGGMVRQATDGMEFSIYYWGNDDGAGRDKYRLLLEGAKFADENGFCAVWTPERHFHAFGGPYPNPSVTGAAVAAVTRNIGVRSGSCVAPLHHPARIAEEWAVIDNLTNGRAGLAIASGWQPDDFVLRPENSPPDNKAAMFEAMDQVRKLWRGEPVAFPRKDGKLHEVITQPRPVSQELPIWVTTAGNPETWREAGRNGANVLTHLLGQSIPEVGEKIALYRQALRDAGHDPDAFTVSLMLHTCLADTRESAREIAREPMKDYLRSAAGLIKQYAWTFPAFKKPQGVKNAFDLDLGDLSEDDLEGILDFAFERYFNESGLFGTIDDALARVDQLKQIGVTEIACLIDYGISTDQVLDGLRPLADVVRKAAPSAEHKTTDFSVAAMLARHDVTHLQCTPSMARMMLMDDDARSQLRNLKHLFLGGEALSGALRSDLSKATDAQITNMYGPTETTIWSSSALAEGGEATVNIGLPIANTQLYVLDDNLTPVGFGETGELWIGGNGVARGYWQRDAMTSDRFRNNPFAKGRMYRAGDLVQRRPDGRLNFLGRADSQVKLRGFRIELGEIEAAVQSLDGVTNAVVLAREDVPGDVRLVAYLTSTKTIETQAMRAALGARLPDYMMPAHFVTLESFPVTPNHKIDRSALPAPGALPVRPKPDAASASPTVEQADEALRMQIADVWTEVLGVHDIAPTSNFFDLGGHSLLAVQTHRILRDRLNIPKLSITDIFQHASLQALADRVAKLRGDTNRVGNVAPIVPPNPKDRAQARTDAMARRRAMRARRQA